MMEKAYSLFLCVLLILVLFLPSTAAGRALLQTAQTEGEGGYHGGNGGSKIDIQPHHSGTAPSRTGVSSPSHATPSGGNGGSKMGVTGSRSKPAPSKTGVSSPSGPTPLRKSVTACTQNRYRACIPQRRSCNLYSRNCK